MKKALLVTLLAAGAGAQLVAQRETVLKQIAVPHNYYFREMYLPQVTTGPGWVAWMPDGRSLVYSMAGTLWRQSLGSDTATQLTDGPGYDYQPDVAPDGRRVVYSSYRNDQVELRVLDLTSGADLPMVSDGAVNVEPRWSPDGVKVAFVSTAFEGRWHLFVLDVRSGGPPVRITADHQSGLPRYYYSPWDHFISPTWSPDGRELILVSNAGRIWGSGGFWRMDARPGGVPRQIWFEETTWKGRPDWSRDGKRVVYSSYLGRQWNQLWLMTSEGGDPFQLTYGNYDNTNPRWSPDGTKIAFISNQTGNTALQVIAVPGGAIETVTPRTRRYHGATSSLTIAVVDPAGRPTAARVSVTGPDGRGYFPADAWAHADDGFDRADRRFEFTYFHSAGSSQLEVPPGRYVVETTKGLEYARRVDTVTVSGPRAAYRVALRRMIDFPAQGWFSGDLHIHMNYGGHYRNTPARLRFQAEAEDLHVAENLVVNKEGRVPDIESFSGALDPVSTKTTLIKHDQEYHTSYWGHSGLLGLTRHFVVPAYAGYTNTAAASLFPHNTKIFEVAHAQGGVTGYVHPFESVPDFSKGETTTVALPIDAALGRIDYLEIVGFSNHLATAEIWYRLLNTGVRLPAGAGTDAMANYASLRGPVGMGRVFVQSGTLDYARWLGALKAGRTMASNGPLLTFTLEGRGIGSTIVLPAGRHRLTATLSLRSIVEVDSLQIVQNGLVVHSVDLSRSRTDADATVSVIVDRSGWVSVRAFSRRARHPTLDLYPFGTTSPIYVEVGGAPIWSAADAGYFIQWLDQLVPQVERHPGWNSDAERALVLGDIAKARAFFSSPPPRSR